ncbi:MAG: hypothetical protein ACREJO_00405 [Phycisphaerales bacterium]
MSFSGFHRGRRKSDPLPEAIAEFGDRPIAPDLSASILDRVGAQRPFFETRTQIAVRWTKIVCGSLATGLAVLFGAALWFAPEILPWQQQPRPISAVVHSAVGDAKNGMSRLDALRRSVESLAARDVVRAPRAGWVDNHVAGPLVRVGTVVRPEASALDLLPIRAMWGAGAPGVTSAAASTKIEPLPHAGELPASWLDSGGGSDLAVPAPAGADGPGVTPQ